MQDGHFVDNLTIGPPVVASLRQNSDEAFLDCHLMVSEPAKWVKVRIAAHASCLSTLMQTLQWNFSDPVSIPQASSRVLGCPVRACCPVHIRCACQTFVPS